MGSATRQGRRWGQRGKLPLKLPVLLPIFPGHGARGDADWTAGHGIEYVGC